MNSTSEIRYTRKSAKTAQTETDADYCEADKVLKKLDKQLNSHAGENVPERGEEKEKGKEQRRRKRMV